MKRELLGVEKVAGADNPADLATKHVSAEVRQKHFERLGIRTGGGIARSAPLLDSLATRSAVSRRRNRRGGTAQRNQTKAAGEMARTGGAADQHGGAQQTAARADALQSWQRRVLFEDTAGEI